MQADPFDEEAFFAAVSASGARALLIGRRALIALGINVMTSDYDFWIHPDDIEKLNAAVEPLDMVPNRSPAEARQRGRYVLENGVCVDVLTSRANPTVTGARVAFDDVWQRRQLQELARNARIALPSIPDLIATKQFGARPKDAEDIRLLHQLLAQESK